MDLHLAGQAVLVTGGNRGLGLAAARALVAEGARVALLARDADALGSAARLLGEDTVTVVADTADDAAVRAAVDEAAERLGRLDVVVNAAAPRARGGSGGAGLESLDEQAFHDHLDVKVLGYARVARAALPHLRAAGGGRIVNISGLNARRTGAIIGSVRNIGVVALSKNLADELGPEGIAVTCVHPGLTLTERSEGDDDFTRAAAQNALGRAVEADEIARVVAFLASPLSSALNGAVIEAAGGIPGPIWA